MDKKRYILFAYDSYYPSGGMDDAKVAFEIEEYEEVKNKWLGKYDWFHVFDVETFITYEASKGEMPKIN
jgi:hypothetical protein